MKVLDPIAEVNPVSAGKPRAAMESANGKRVGFIWDQHTSSARFWPALEETIVSRYKPSEVHRLYHQSTWNAEPIEKIRELAGKIDYAIVGVGA